MKFTRREMLGAAGALTAVGVGLAGADAATEIKRPRWLNNAIQFGNRFVAWQAPWGATDPLRCPYRDPSNPLIIQGIGPQVRALYRLFEATNVYDYKAAADRYATFFLAMLHDPPTPLLNTMTIEGKRRHCVSSAWMFGKGLSPCYEYFMRYNPQEASFAPKAYAIHRWLQRHRRDDSYFGVGYAAGKYEDAQFSCDLGEVGMGLVGFYNIHRCKPALDDAIGLARYFLTDYQEGSGRGVWSPQLGVWLVGPWPGGGAEHSTNQSHSQSAWGWSCLVDGEYLLGLRKHVDDPTLRRQIDEKCTSALRWCLDSCQFEDGAHGMFGRDDKWVGQGAAAILLYALLREQQVMAEEVERTCRPKIEKTWQWLLDHSDPAAYPPDGYIRVNGTTTTSPPENIMWMMAWTAEALLAGGKIFDNRET